MKGMLIMRSNRTLGLLIILLGCLMLAGVAVYQQTQRGDELPGRVGPTAAPSGAGGGGTVPSANPEDQFGREPSDQDVLHLWAKAASTGDYSTARLYMEEDAIMTANWESQHEYLVKSIRDYHISNIDVRGQTTNAVVRFDQSSTSHCLSVRVNNITKRLSVPNAYRDCRAGE